jgi:hypothetical protein
METATSVRRRFLGSSQASKKRLISGDHYVVSVPMSMSGGVIHVGSAMCSKSPINPDSGRIAAARRTAENRARD